MNEDISNIFKFKPKAPPVAVLVSSQELRALYGVMDFAAYQSGINICVIEKMLSAWFGVDHPCELQMKDYDTAINYLVGLSSRPANLN